ncbi:MAG: hypothetical protein H0V63_10715 [Burkholderiaceae bacterium]|nr:hypothetical protein [Burkholderiaceae bacterium]
MKASLKQRVIPVSIVFTVAATGLVGCATNSACPSMGFERFARADRIVITDNLNRELRTVTDKPTLDAINEFAMSQRDGFSTPFAGTPVALLRANFYSGAKFLGDFGVGRTFLSAQGCGSFHSRGVAPDDRATIMRLFAVKDPYVRTQ